MKSPLIGRKGCQYHRDLVNVGPANGNYKHGKYSKFAPKNIDKRIHELRELRNDADNLSLRAEIELTEVRLSQLIETLNTSASLKTFKEIRKARLDILAAVKSQDTQLMQDALVILDKISTLGAKEYRGWEELFKVQKHYESLIASERQKLMQDKFMLSITEAQIIFAMIAHAINEKVPNVQDRKAVMREIEVIAVKSGFEM